MDSKKKRKLKGFAEILGHFFLRKKGLNMWVFELFGAFDFGKSLF